MEFDPSDSLDRLMAVWSFTRKKPTQNEIKRAKEWKTSFERWYMDHVFDQDYADRIFEDASAVMADLKPHQYPPLLIELAKRALPRYAEPSVSVVVAVPERVETLKEKVQKQFDRIWSQWPHSNIFPIPEAVGYSAFSSVCKSLSDLEKVVQATEYYFQCVDRGDIKYGFTTFFRKDMSDLQTPFWQVYYHRSVSSPSGIFEETFETVWAQLPPSKGATNQEWARLEFKSYVKNADDCLRVIAAARAYCEERFETSEDEKNLIQYTASYQRWIQSWREQEGTNEELGKMLAEYFVETFPQLVTGMYDPAPYLTMVLKQGKTLATGTREVAEFFSAATKKEFDTEQIKGILRKTLQKALRTVKTYTLS